MNAHSAPAELATVARKARGSVPPKLVGASTTVVGDKMYLFGGRLVVERRMLSDLYVLDLHTATWAKVEVAVESVIPGPRYFHSADTWNNHIVIFGGMGYKTPDSTQDSLCVLNDVCFFSLTESRWLPPDEMPASPLPPQSLIPRARYAHLSSVSSNLLFIIGGQDLDNGWLDDIHLYDLPSRKWVHRSNYPRHCGTYRSIALSSPLSVRDPNAEPPPPAAPRFRLDSVPPVIPVSSPDTFLHLPYSTVPTPKSPSEIFLYSNYNFTDVKRELEVFTPQPPSSFTITDRSTAMTGFALPPGLRFPTGALLGNSLIIAGTYLAHSFQAFSIWSLDLPSMSWSRIEPGTALATGSWCRAVLWRETNKLLVFGNREGNLVEDYNHRLLSWDDIAYIDLEAFGIYQPPCPGYGFGREAQAMGLAALEDGAFADFEVVCDDDRHIACSRKLLEDRWPWFRTQRQRYVAAASTIVDVSGASAIPPLQPFPGSGEALLPRTDPRLTPRTLHIDEPYPITVAFLQYLYAQTLLTPLQHAPPVLSALLMLASTYDLPHLRDLVKHAMHRALNAGPSGSSGVYEVATLCDCQSLRLRAMRMFRKRLAGRARSGRSEDRHGGSGSSQGRGSGQHRARPRGMSDANQSQVGSSMSAERNSQGSGPGQTNDSTSQPVVKDSLKSQHGNSPQVRPKSQPVNNVPSMPTSGKRPTSGRSSSVSSNKSSNQGTDVSRSETKTDNLFTEDEDETEHIGLDSSISSLEPSSSAGDISRVSYNVRPSWPQHQSHPSDSDDYYFGTQPDLSPLTSTFSAIEKPLAFHLPYPAAYRVSRSTSFSDSPSSSANFTSEEGQSSGNSSTSSANSSVPATPLSPAIAEIVDAVARVSVAAPSPDRRLTRQISLRSIHEDTKLDEHSDGFESDTRAVSLYNFPLPPPHKPVSHHQLPKLKTSLTDISEVEHNHTRAQGRLHIDTTHASRAPNENPSGMDLPLSPRSLKETRSDDRLGLAGRRTSLNNLSQSGTGLARLLSPRRSANRLEKEAAKARIKADKLEQKLREQQEKDRRHYDRDQEIAPTPTTIFSGLWPPKSPKSEDKRR